MPPDMPSNASEKDTDGFFLVGVLAFCFILIPVIATFAQSSKAIARSASGANERFKIEFLAAGLAEALASKLTLDHDLVGSFQAAGSVDCQFQQAVFRFKIQDHDGKIDLNNADSGLLKIGFKAAGLSDEHAGLLQQYTEAFRSNSYSPDAGSALSNLPSLKHAPFERIEELNDAIAALKLAPIDFEPYFTVYKLMGNLEYETAAKPLQAIADASPEIKAQLATDNGSFDYLDVRVDVRHNGRSYAFLDTFVRLSVAGEVREIARNDLPVEVGMPPLSSLDNSTTCESLLGLGKAPAIHG